MRRMAWVISLVMISGACSSSHPLATTPRSTTSTATNGPPAKLPANPPAVTRRQADAEGLHYTITLTTPRVVPGGLVRVVVRLTSRTTHIVGACTIGHIAVFEPGRRRPSIKTFVCSDIGIFLHPGRSMTYAVHTTAPAQPGNYLVAATEVFDHTVPTSALLPLNLQVTQARTHAAG